MVNSVFNYVRSDSAVMKIKYYMTFTIALLPMFCIELSGFRKVVSVYLILLKLKNLLCIIGCSNNK